MKKYLAVLAVLSVLALSAAAFAADGAALFASKCASCHGADGTETSKTGGKAVKGLSEADALKDMHGYLDGSFGGPKKAIMQAILKKLSHEDMMALAAHIGKL